MSKQRIFITGVSGLLGNNLAFFFRDSYHVAGFYFQHPVHIEGIVTGGASISMNVGKLERALGIAMPTVEEFIRHFYEDHKKGLPAAIRRHK